MKKASKVTVNIDGLEVEIRAKGLESKQFNLIDTLHILNYLSIVLSEAADGNQRIFGIHESDERGRRADSKRLYEVCKELGLYK